jgi:NAD(P)-dependent dehydrogenase (short-subunit alcohol dehydrogenase family)
MSDLNGKSVLITGGSRGLGRALAIGLAAKGAKVAIVARQKRSLTTSSARSSGNGGTAFGIVADVGDKESVYPIVGQRRRWPGPVDILINNASTLGPVPLRLIPDTDCEDFERALAGKHHWPVSADQGRRRFNDPAAYRIGGPGH